ncbi:MAG: type II toxin-antitoxin system HipA family toxin YjjJ [Opitutales bacterium]|nr:type II toxin-antitoxin system HipA family toxin YjjJ [Opitutales bacterium]MCH8539260.1 type II toxin-antitoxin system HipA family toxin YjjJ [Opitutales bacterium]
MYRSSKSAKALLSYLRMRGPTFSRELVADLGISRPTLSRRVRELGDALVPIGKGRATQLAARHEAAGDAVPLYQVQESGKVDLFGRLTALQQGETILWYMEPENPQAALCADEFKEGLFPGWPWFLENVRPEGFLGRALGQQMSSLFGVDKDPGKWNDFELLKVLVAFGANLPGNFILGDGPALANFQKFRIEATGRSVPYLSASDYPEQARRALHEGEVYGSSAGGEQPKFTSIVGEAPEGVARAVLVKFSPGLETEVGRRWADLLQAEHLANETLREAGFATAQTRVLQYQDRIFLESERFDRVGLSGRRGLVPLRALDAAYIGQTGDSWAEAARKLHAGKLIKAEDRDRMIHLHCFGSLIANTDMHWGNLSFFLPGAPPFPLAPVYDMLPMHFRPSDTGEVPVRRFEPRLPKPENQAAWLEMYPHALRYWQRIQQCTEISSPFQTIAEQAITALEKIHPIVAQS